MGGARRRSGAAWSSGAAVQLENEQHAERRDQRGREAKEPHARAAGGGWRVRELHAQGARGAVRAKCIRMRLAHHRFARKVVCARGCYVMRAYWYGTMAAERGAASSHSASTWRYPATSPRVAAHTGMLTGSWREKSLKPLKPHGSTGVAGGARGDQ